MKMLNINYSFSGKEKIEITKSTNSTEIKLIKYNAENVNFSHMQIYFNKKKEAC